MGELNNQLLSGANSAGNMQWDKEGKKIFLQTDGGIAKIDAASGKVERISISGDMVLDVAAEREIMYNHVLDQNLQPQEFVNTYYR